MTRNANPRNAGLRRFVPGAAPDGPAVRRAAPVPRVAPVPAAVPVRPADSAWPAAAAGPGSREPRAWPAGEKCELCRDGIPAGHGHVADLESATLICACRACYLLFTQPQGGRGRYKAVPDRYLHDPQRPLTAAEWDQLEIPVGLAFFLHSSRRGEVTGFYPSPAGATECILDLTAWDRLAARYPLLAAAQADVEAALICRAGAGVEYFLVPVDACYELAGRMRLHWRGFDGGAQARASIDAFLDNVRSRARAVSREA